MRLKANIDLTLDDMLVLEYAIDTAIAHVEFLKSMDSNLPELKPEYDIIGSMTKLRDKCKELFV